jgi:hypothetical protein
VRMIDTSTGINSSMSMPNAIMMYGI